MLPFSFTFPPNNKKFSLLLATLLATLINYIKKVVPAMGASSPPTAIKNKTDSGFFFRKVSIFFKFVMSVFVNNHIKPSKL